MLETSSLLYRHRTPEYAITIDITSNAMYVNDVNNDYCFENTHANIWAEGTHGISLLVVKVDDMNDDSNPVKPDKSIKYRIWVSIT